MAKIWLTLRRRGVKFRNVVGTKVDSCEMIGEKGEPDSISEAYDSVQLRGGRERNYRRLGWVSQVRIVCLEARDGLAATEKKTGKTGDRSVLSVRSDEVPRNDRGVVSSQRSSGRIVSCFSCDPVHLPTPPPSVPYMLCRKHWNIFVLNMVQCLFCSSQNCFDLEFVNESFSVLWIWMELICTLRMLRQGVG